MIDLTDLCQECLMTFNGHNQIYIMTNNRGAELTICHICRFDYDWTGWNDSDD